MNNRLIYFNEKEHKYTDDLANPYISCTTLVSEYINKFDEELMSERCAKAGRNGNPKYAGKTATQLKSEWATTRILACARGNERHDFLENTIKDSNGYKKIEGTRYINDRIYTIADILEDDSYGRVYLDFFVKTGIKEKYPQIYILIKYYVEQGYKIYSEVCAFNYDCKISGLIDLLLIKDDTFVIIDWKTNKADITWTSGYYQKDAEGNLTDNFVEKNEYFKYPLVHIPDSIGHHYTLQLSIYNYLVEGFGLKHISNMLCHIRYETHTDDSKILKILPELYGKEKVDFVPINYLKDDVKLLFEHYYSKNVVGNQTQLMI